MCKVSVIMGIYNMESNFLIAKLAINSILNQTYTDFEFIICDDGSNDKTYQMVEFLVKGDSRVILIKNDKNRGLAYSLNQCLRIAKGKYIARMDADDISILNRLEEEVNFLDNNDEYALVGCNLELIDDNGIWGKRILPKNPNKKDCLFGPPFAHPSIMIRKDVIDKLNGYSIEKIILK